MKLRAAWGVTSMVLMASGAGSSAVAADDGWTVLFDGSSTAAWRGYGRDSFPTGGWAVENGSLKTIVGGDRCDIVTREKYAGFELELEWKVSPAGNSGVIYRVGEGPEAAWHTGPEMQLLDDSGHRDGKDPRTSAGSLYALIAPKGAVLKPVGEFNSARVAVRGRHVEHWLNGARLLEYELGSPELAALVADSKFKDMPRFAREAEGHVALQHHGEEVWFRNVRIRRLDGKAAQASREWGIHDMERPVPPVVAPGTASTQEAPGRPPSDAVVLFDGNDLSRWRSEKGGEAAWKVENGYMEVVKGTGAIRTEQAFGDVQLHIEWMTAPGATGEGQARSNSGVFLMGRYEVQVLDSYRNRTYADGQAAAVYGQQPPLVNASRPPGEWQTYDIVFEAPRFGAGGKLERKARVTVLHNGVLAQHAVEPTGPTAHKARPPYEAHADKLPLVLQDHGDPVRFRNVWVRELPRID